jgi:hypothetical protein
MAGLDEEWVALAVGLKPAIRCTVAPPRADDVEARLRRAGLAVVRADRDALLDGQTLVVLYAARSAEGAIALREAEAPILPGHAPANAPPDVDAHREVGRLLGYPACCVDAFCERLVRGVDVLPPSGPSGLHEDYVLARLAFRSPADARINPFLRHVRIQTVSFYPCNFDCPVASVLAERLLVAIERRHRGAARAILASLARPLALERRGARAYVLADRGGFIENAEAPRDRSGRADPRDEAFAQTLFGARIGDRGVLDAAGDAPPVVVPFSWSTR